MATVGVNQRGWCVYVCVLHADESFLLSNVRLSGHPIVYCSEGFTQMTGWSKRDLLRRSAACSMMHGPLTAQDALTRLLHALASDTATEPFEIILYTNNGKLRRYADLVVPYRP